MAIISITLYKTVVVNKIVQSDSVPVTLYIDDENSDGRIDRAEWSNYTGSRYGDIAGDTTPAALFQSMTGSTAPGIATTGTLYSAASYTAGEDASSILDGLGRLSYSPLITDLSICYLAGTMIANPTGEKAVETLQAGDLVLTRDNGAQPLVWAGSTPVSERDLDLQPNLHPIRICAGALGDGLPRRDVDVSPQHRILVTDEAGTEFIISARHLLRAGQPGVMLHPNPGAYQQVHLACNDHQILLAEGAPMESFFTGEMAIRALPAAQLLGLIAALPQIGMGQNPMTLARPVIRHREYAAMMAARVCA